MGAHVLEPLAAVICAVLISVSDSARAWGPDGHAIVAQIAELRLDPAVRAKVTQILGQENHQHLDEIAPWADDYRSSHPETGNWHFVDIPLDAVAYDPDRDCAKGDCVVNQIQRSATALSNQQTSVADRLTALKFLVHFVGDIHQPLHCETDFTKFPPPKGDEGGNKITVTYFGKSMKYHALWDTGLIDETLYISHKPGDFTADLAVTRPEAQRLSNEISDGQASAIAPPGLLTNLAVATVQWANASHNLAQQAYDDLPKGQIPPNWDTTFNRNAVPVVDGQLENAGVRLARLLNEALR